MSNEPIDLAQALASFDALWSPRVVTHVNDYDVRVAKVAGEHVWHAHDDTDEFFLVLDGELRISLRESAGERTVRLPRGAVFTVPRGTEHRPHAPGGASILLFEPTGTSSVGDRHEEVPDHVDATTGHALDLPHTAAGAVRDQAGRATVSAPVGAPSGRAASSPDAKLSRRSASARSDCSGH